MKGHKIRVLIDTQVYSSISEAARALDMSAHLLKVVLLDKKTKKNWKTLSEDKYQTLIKSKNKNTTGIR